MAFPLNPKVTDKQKCNIQNINSSSTILKELREKLTKKVFRQKVETEPTAKQLAQTNQILSRIATNEQTAYEDGAVSTGATGNANLLTRQVERALTQVLGKSAFELFNSPDFIAAHSSLPLGNRLSGTADRRWEGSRYPVEDYPTSTDPRISGFILEADFFKFRGRGLIQTTFRGNYKRIIDYIKTNSINHSVIAEYRQRWANLSSDFIATSSTNRDWDRLFHETDYIIPAIAIRLHSFGSGKYLNLPLDAGILNGKVTGSIYNVGLRVSGGSAYAALFRQRVLQILRR